MNFRTRSLVITGLLASLTGCATNHTMNVATCSGNCVSGSGTLTMNGDQYAGTFAMGVMQGPFEVRTSAGDILSGVMVNGHFNGPVNIRNTAGKQFAQEFSAGVPVRGTSILNNGDIYEGSFQAVMFPATVTTIYRQTFEQLQPVAIFQRGRYTTAAGETYTGNFSLVDSRLVVEGTKTRPGQRAETGFHAAAFVPGQQREGFVFAPARKEDVSSWTLAGEARVKSVLASARQVPAAGRTTVAGAASAGTAGAAALAPASAPVSTNMIEGNTGRYLSPFTSDGVAAAWVDKAVNASLGSSIGGMAGAYAGQKALEQVPFVGGFLGQKAGSAAGRGIALKAAGGEAYMRETSDISFNDINEMARWLVQTHASHARFAEIMKAAGQIYPELTPAYVAALRRR